MSNHRRFDTGFSERSCSVAVSTSDSDYIYCICQDLPVTPVRIRARPDFRFLRLVPKKGTADGQLHGLFGLWGIGFLVAAQTDWRLGVA